MIKVYHLRALLLWRWSTVLRFMLKGVRVHPSSIMNGHFKQFQFSRSVKIGGRVRMFVSGQGRIVLGERVWLSHDIEMETSKLVSIGPGSTVQRRTTINGSVTIGEGCIIAPNVFISSGTHPFRVYPDKPIREQERIIIETKGSLSSLDRPITIGDDCWLGVNVVVCPGVSIGEGSVIGANSVVVKDVAANSIVAGVPAKVVGDRIR
ncbi:acyltransferase [Marinobacter sediminicola]|uniref:acyltransferase n=1 Tax=Marinobacter sediminicola TaxID=3072994 RepID=UPI002810F6F3|nr:DapH/DapD/GlmU-related protein [Marinobacter sp. F26243]